MVVVLLCLTGAGAYLGSVVVARHRAQAAADLAALGAAARLPSGVDAACTRAVALAREMRTDVAGCAVDGLDVVVTVQVAALGGVARATARAGPLAGQAGEPGAAGSPAAASSAAVGNLRETSPA